MENICETDTLLDKLVEDLNHMCLEGSDTEMCLLKSKWEREDFVICGRKLKIINDKCVDSIGSICMNCYNKISQARNKFEQIYMDELEKRIDKLEADVAFSRQQLDDLTKFLGLVQNTLI